MKISIIPNGLNHPESIGYDQTTNVVVTVSYLDGKRKLNYGTKVPGALSNLAARSLELAIQASLDELGAITDAEYRKRTELLEQQIMTLQASLRDERAKTDKAVQEKKELNDMLKEYGLTAFITLADKIEHANKTADRLDRAYQELRHCVDLALSRGRD